MTGLPGWLVAHLDATGRSNPDGVGRGARLGRCRRCTRQVLRGLDGDLAAFPAECDPHEIDTNGELLALALGLRTYMLTRSMTSSRKLGWNLDPRTQWGIRAGQRTALVVEHRCGIAIPAAARSWLPRQASLPTPSDVPF